MAAERHSDAAHAIRDCCVWPVSNTVLVQHGVTETFPTSSCTANDVLVQAAERNGQNVKGVACCVLLASKH